MSKARTHVGTGTAARLAGVSPITVTKWFDSGLVEGFVIPGGRNRRVSLVSLRKVLAEAGAPTVAIDRKMRVKP